MDPSAERVPSADNGNRFLVLARRAQWELTYFGVNRITV